MASRNCASRETRRVIPLYARTSLPTCHLQLLGLAVMLYGTAVYNGSVTLPGLEPAEDDLLAEGDKMSSSALSRSPLMTNARLDVGGGSQKSPYAQPSRLPIADPMTSRGGGGDALKERLVGKN